jgi:imidazolonepropionase-like amidohydrolase
MPGDLVITDVTLVDGTGAEPRPHTDVVVRAGRITGILATGGDHGTAPTLPGRGRYLVPGLWETQAHLTRPATGQVPDHIFDWPETGSLTPAATALRSYLHCGVTTVVDLGGPPEALVPLRGLQADGIITGARLQLVGKQLTAPNSGPAIDGRLMSSWAQPVAGAAAARDEIQRMVEEYDVAAIKVIYSDTHGLAGPGPRISRALLEEIVAEAHRHGRPVIAHCDDSGSAIEAVLGGADAVEHMFAAPEGEVERDIDTMIEECAARGTYWSMTIAMWEAWSRLGDAELLADIGVAGAVPRHTLDALHEPGGWWAQPPPIITALGSQMLGQSMTSVARAFAAGVRMSTSTDAGNAAVFHGPAVHREMALMARAGLAPADVLQTATRLAAEKFGQGKEIGTVQSGKIADLLLLRQDPLTDVSHLRDIERVIIAGIVHDPDALRVT